MKGIFTFIFTLAVLAGSAKEPIEIQLWRDGAPQSNGITAPETKSGSNISNVSNPTMFVYLAEKEKNTGAALLICPGGGYARLAINHEGHEIAKWLAAEGINAAVLKYRMPNGHHEVPLSDAKQAMRIIRTQAAEWDVNPQKIGVAGSSAGGHLASTLSTHFDAETRPDFSVLFYPVITMDTVFTHMGSRSNLLGKSPAQDMVDLYSNEKQVTAQTPPTILLLSDDDRGVVPRNSVEYYMALKANNVPAAMYIFPNGGHGWGFRNSYKYHEEWKNLLLKWLRDNGFGK